MAPYSSDKQRKFFHTDTAKKKGITPKIVDEFDEASKGMDLPEYKDPRPMNHAPDMKSHWRGRK